MASTTTNYGLAKPVYSEKADVAAMNTNMDTIDAALGGLDAGIAIVANGNTHAAISEGQYVYIRGHNSLAEGLYRATANIAANGTLSGPNVTSAVMGTALAALSGSTVKYTDVIDNLTSTETSKPLSAKQGKALSDQIETVTGQLDWAVKYTNARVWPGTSITITIPNGGSKGQYRVYLLNVVQANDGINMTYTIGTQNSTTPYVHKMYGSDGNVVSSVAYASDTTLTITFNVSGYFYVTMMLYSIY